MNGSLRIVVAVNWKSVIHSSRFGSGDAYDPNIIEMNNGENLLTQTGDLLL
ncbi:hypothetical protein SCALIN_C13_0118 [Candidatus Scalindua japonica]|uniref:Uncharacterized protein n=1 Tax=Candidatus Scalindua japonica TaxID=1284222 RepID=A0A286TXI0_9BACT|nr:hypothetical protein SCALIN_C13_0118 [Candidatus Scalindua japonica]